MLFSKYLVLPRRPPRNIFHTPFRGLFRKCDGNNMITVRPSDGCHPSPFTPSWTNPSVYCTESLSLVRTVVLVHTINEFRVITVWLQLLCHSVTVRPIPHQMQYYSNTSTYRFGSKRYSDTTPTRSTHVEHQHQYQYTNTNCTVHRRTDDDKR